MANCSFSFSGLCSVAAKCAADINLRTKTTYLEHICAFWRVSNEGSSISFNAILCAVLWGRLRQWWTFLWFHLVDKKVNYTERNAQEWSRPSYCISNHPPFNTKSRYNIYIHGLKGKNKVHMWGGMTSSEQALNTSLVTLHVCVCLFIFL